MAHSGLGVNVLVRFRAFLLVSCLSVTLSLFLYFRGTFPVFYPTHGHSDLTPWIPREQTELFEGPPLEKWIVVTSKSTATCDIAYLSELSGWQTVVVGDRKTPVHRNYKNCIYLDIKKQKSLGFNTRKLLPEGNYSRKIVGFLYAIANGANVIYELSNDMRPLDKLTQFLLQPRVTSLMYTGEKFFNPYRHFGQPTVWPRGYPLQFVGENISNRYLLSSWKAPLIQQGVANGDPDMDAIFRLTRKPTASILNVTLDGRAPPVILPADVFAPFNTRNTLFLYDGFWGLFIPTTTALSVWDIWRGYWTQRLLWEIGGNLGFVPANVFPKSTPHSYLDDYNQEKQFSDKTLKLITFLRLWICPRRLTFFQCAILLSQTMAKKGFWKISDVDLVKAWITDLRALRYTEPKRLQMDLHDIFKEQLPGPHNLQNFSSKYFQYILQSRKNFSTVNSLYFWAKEQPPPLQHSDINHLRDSFSQADAVRRLCPDISLSLPPLTMKRKLNTYPNILLIIVYNFPLLYKNIPAMMDIYNTHFPQILHCGSDINEFLRISLAFPNQVSFIEVDIHEGYFNYRCLMQAMKMHYNVEGYLLASDDVLLNVWNFNTLPTNKIWFVEQRGTLHNFDNFTTSWGWWNTLYGRQALNNALNELKSIDGTGTLHTLFMKTLEVNTGGRNRVFFAGSDVIYIPEILKREALFFMDVFSRNYLFLEIALPVMVAGICRREDVFILKGTYLWPGEDRDVYWKFFKRTDVFVHPVKWGVEYKQPQGYSFFCKTFLPLTLF